MHFGNFRVYSVNIGNKKKSDASRKTPGAFPSAVVIMTTADRTHPAFAGRHPKLFLFPIFTDLFRHFTEIAEVHYTPVTLIAKAVAI